MAFELARLVEPELELEKVKNIAGAIFDPDNTMDLNHLIYTHKFLHFLHTRPKKELFAGTFLREHCNW